MFPEEPESLVLFSPEPGPGFFSGKLWFPGCFFEKFTLSGGLVPQPAPGRVFFRGHFLVLVFRGFEQFSPGQGVQQKEEQEVNVIYFSGTRGHSREEILYFPLPDSNLV